MSVARAAQALLDLVAADRERKCAAVLDDARARASTLLAQAHADARARMRATFAEERERMTARVAGAQAMLATKQRLAEQRRAAALLAAGWQRLPDALLEVWHDPAARRAWVERIAADAHARLPAGAWQVVHAPDWPAAEREAFVAALAGKGAAAELVADPGARAGLKIAASGNVLDGTLSGLTADRSESGALLLRELETGEAAV
jgi:hypothetical protein